MDTVTHNTMCQQVVISKRNSEQETDTRFRPTLYVYAYIHTYMHMTPKRTGRTNEGKISQTAVRVPLPVVQALFTGMRP